MPICLNCGTKTSVRSGHVLWFGCRYPQRHLPSYPGDLCESCYCNDSGRCYQCELIDSANSDLSKVRPAPLEPLIDNDPESEFDLGIDGWRDSI